MTISFLIICLNLPRFCWDEMSFSFSNKGSLVLWVYNRTWDEQNPYLPVSHKMVPKWECYIASFYIPSVNKMLVSFAYKEKVNHLPSSEVLIISTEEKILNNDAIICIRIFPQAQSSNQNFQFLTHYENQMYIYRNWSACKLWKPIKNYKILLFLLVFLFKSVLSK